MSYLTCIEKLARVGSASISPVKPNVLALEAMPRKKELLSCLQYKNGFYAFESALHLFPLGNHEMHMSLERWNELSSWKKFFGGIADDLYCFAEDIFGDQFAIVGEKIVSFNGETGERQVLADSLEEWACLVLTDFEFISGYPFAHAWQEKHGPLSSGHRLAPKRPFVLGGEYSMENFYEVEAIAAMRFKGDLCTQISSLPDGTRTKIEVK